MSTNVNIERIQLITNLPIANPLNGQELTVVVQNGATLQSNIGQFGAYSKGLDYSTWVYGNSAGFSTVESLTANWNSAYSTLCAQSANNVSVYSTFNTQSANNASVYSTFNTQSANNASVYSYVNSNTANWNTISFLQALSANNLSVYSTFNTQSANNASVYSTFNTQSANNLSVYSTFNTQSANNLSVYSTFNTQSANNASVYSTFNTQSANNVSVYSTFNTQSANNVSVYSTVNTQSANNVSVYSTFNTQSANNASVYSNLNILSSIYSTTSASFISLNASNNLTVAGTISSGTALYTSGNIGAGTGIPTYQLQVQTSNQGQFGQQIAYGTGSYPPAIYLFPNVGAGTGTSITQAGDELITFNGAGGLNSGALTIAPYGGTGGIRMLNNGNIGINTAPTNSLLTINGSISSLSSIYIGNLQSTSVLTSASPTLNFDQRYSPLSGAINKINLWGGIYGFGIAAGELSYVGQNHIFYPNSNAPSISAAMIIASNGNVGIGNNVFSSQNLPNQSLTVVGNISATGSLLANNVSANNIFAVGNQTVLSDGYGSNDTGNGANTISLNYANGTYIGLSGTGSLYALRVPQYFEITSNYPSAIGVSTISPYFVNITNPYDYLQPNARYEIEYNIQYLKPVAGGMTYYISADNTFSSASFNSWGMNSDNLATATGYVYATVVINKNIITYNNTNSFGGTSVSSNNIFKVYLKTASSPINLGLFVTGGSGGIYPLQNSYRKVTRVY